MLISQNVVPWQQSHQAGFKNRLHLGLERLQKRHLARRGKYFRVRAFLPLPILALVWYLEYEHAKGTYHGMLHATVTIEHLVETFSAATLWSFGSRTLASRTMNAVTAIKSELQSLLITSFCCGALLYLLVGLRGYWADGARVGLIIFAAFIVSSVLLLLTALSSSMGWLPDPGESRKALIIGSGPRAAKLYNLANHNFGFLELVGFLDDPEFHNVQLPASHYLGSLERLPQLLKDQPINLVLIGLPVRSKYEAIQDVVLVCENVGVECHYPLDIFETSRTTAESSTRSTLVAAHDQISFDVRHWIKRGLDIILAGLAVVALSPLLIAIAIAVKVSSRGPICFVQQRYGLNRVRFPMFKFRSMVVNAEALQTQLEAQNEAQGPVFKMRKDPRVTKVGAFLRKTSLDELPQLFNVLRGEMAIVGPRPLPLRDVSRFNEAWLLRRFSVRPGLTCLWQVRGRSNTMFDEWMQLDLRYIDTWTLTGDFIIILQTIPALLKGSGAM